jgi:hypothetical protein
VGEEGGRGDAERAPERERVLVGDDPGVTVDLVLEEGLEEPERPGLGAGVQREALGVREQRQEEGEQADAERGQRPAACERAGASATETDCFRGQRGGGEDLSAPSAGTARFMETLRRPVHTDVWKAAL